MSLDKDLAGLSPGRGTALTIGVFDGVHLGHQYLLSRLREHARQRGLLSAVITFRQHPEDTLSGQNRLSYLTTLPQRTKLIKAGGIDEVVVLAFTPELANIGAHQFISLLQKRLKMESLIIGPDFALGKNREGDTETLRTLGQDMGFTVILIPPIIIDGEVVSSTAIRSALAEGDMKRVYNMAGRYFNVPGRVVPGTHRGVQLGFPTANLEPDPEQGLPADGVYATWAYIDNNVYPSMTNIGRRPSFGENQRTVEVYILEYRGDLYGREMSIDVVERLRDEIKFDTAEALKSQIAEDVKQGKAILTARGRE
jgi:riboflavin kinase/FMN adenylyltransferase